MNHSFLNSLRFCFFLIPVLLFGQTHELSFEFLRSELGQGPGAVFSIMEDSNGFVWLASQGALVRYDGNTLNFYTNRTYDPHSFSKGQAYGLSEDSKGRIWIGTDRDLAVFDPKTDLFNHFVIPSKNENELGERIYNAREDRNGNIWINSENGLYILNEDSHEFKLIRAHNSKVNKAFYYTCPLLETKSGSFYAGTPDGLFLVDINSFELKNIPLKNQINEMNALQIMDLKDCMNFIPKQEI